MAEVGAAVAATASTVVALGPVEEVRRTAAAGQSRAGMAAWRRWIFGKAVSISRIDLH